MTRNASETVSPLSGLLDRSALRRAAGARSFGRGEDYFASGQVGSLAEHRGAITAKDQGTRRYQVKLWAEGGELRYSCTCPVGQDGAFCKHCVAAGLAWLDQGRPDKATGKKSGRPAVTMDDARAWLAAQDKDALVGMLMEQAMEDDRLRRRLLLKAAKREGEHPEDAVPVYQRLVEPTLHRKNNEAYREAVELLRKVQGLMARLGRQAEFARYLDSVRAAHKPKRNFMKLLDGGKWS